MKQLNSNEIESVNGASLAKQFVRIIIEGGIYESVKYSVSAFHRATAGISITSPNRMNPTNRL